MIAGALAETADEARAQAERALGRELAELRECFDAAPTGAAVLSSDRRWSAVNASLCALLEAEADELLGSACEEAIHPEDRSLVSSALQGLESEHPATVAVRARLLRGSGDDRQHVELRAAALRAHEQRRMLLHVHEASDPELRRRRELLRLILEHTPAAVAMLDRELRYLIYNRRWLHEYQLGELDLTGVSHEEVLPELSGVWRELCQRFLEGAVEASEGEEVLRRDGTEQCLCWEARPWRDRNGEIGGIVIFSEDVTARRAEELERRKLEARVQQAQKLESLGVLAGGVAHDFNNLLVGVLGNAGLALGELSPESTAREYVQRVEHAARRAADLTKQLLAYSGRGRFLVERLDLNRLVREMVHLLQLSLSKKATLRYRLQDGLQAIEADATQLRQVVMNLILNASEALGEEAGTITISTGMVDADDAYLWTTYLNEQLTPGRYVTLEVSDTGCGMDEETIERVFEPFYSTKLVGRGLGLAAVLGIVRGHRGAIKIYSEPGAGTTFKVLFPAVEGDPTQPPADDEAQVDDASWRGVGTVLVVDDEQAVRQVACATLEHVGFDVLTAHNGREALRVFAERADSILLVLLDMTMPELDGVETFRELRRLDPKVKVLLSSGFNEVEATSSFAGKGLAGFLEKPYRPADLVAKVRATLGQ